MYSPKFNFFKFGSFKSTINRGNMIFVTYPKNILSSVEFTAHLREVWYKWQVMFHNCVDLFSSSL